MFGYNHNHLPVYRGNTFAFYPPAAYTPTNYVYEGSFQPMYYNSLRYPLYTGLNFIPQYHNWQLQYTLPPNEVIKLKGKRIRTTLPNIAGTVTATVGDYDSSSNRVQLLNIISDRTGINYGNLNYMPDEISGLEVLDGSQPDRQPEREGDCSVIGGKGKRLDSGTVGLRVLDLEYIIYECAIEVKPKIAGINTGGTYTLSATNKGVNATWPIIPEVSRYVFSVYVENSTLWVELEMQHRTLQGFPPRAVWRKTWGAKTKVGSWVGLKF